MNLRSLSVASFLCLLLMILGPRAGFAQQVQPLEPEWLRQMYAEGWEKVQEGVLRRDAGDGQYETLSYGAEGLQWVIEGYERQLVFLEDRYNEAPSEDLAGVIEKLQGEIDKLSEDLQAAPSAEGVDGSVMAECTQMAYGGDASAGPLQSPQGITATATAYFQNACGIIGDTSAVAYADAISAATGLHDTHNQDDPSQGTWIDSSATASAVGSTGCSSWAQASVTINGDMVFQTPLAQSTNCSLPVQASITGPATATADYYVNDGCVNVTWTASATQGTPGYTYQWYIGDTSQGTGSTLTKSYCKVSKSETVRVVATDSQGGMDDATFTTNIQYIKALTAAISGPTSITTNSSTPCANVTWFAGVVGGHPGYTYSWYIGTGTTVLGTGSSFTQQYCSTSKTVTAKVVVRDSDGHTANATKTTTITHTSPTPVTASISGPAEVTIYRVGDCRSLSWTASATGGTSGYTYTWYLGTSTTAAGTGGTLTKTFCGPQTIDVKVIARDSSSPAQTDDATFRTVIYYERLDTGECGTGICP